MTSSGPRETKEVPAANFGKLFVGQVPAVATEDLLLPLFQPYGNLLEIKIMRDQQGRSKGCAWVRYETQQQAQAAIEALHEKHVIPPQTNVLQVRYAAPSSRPRQRNFDSNMSNVNAGRLMGEPRENRSTFQPYNPQVMAGWQMMAQQNAMYGQFAPNVENLQWPAMNRQSQNRSGATPGVSCFVGNLPPDTTSEELQSLFQQSLELPNPPIVRIHREKRFGFAEFETPSQATEAANVLNNHYLHDRNIRVEVTQREPRNTHNAQMTQFASGYGYGYQ